MEEAKGPRVRIFRPLHFEGFQQCSPGLATMLAAPHARPAPTGRPAVDSATVEKGNRLVCWLWSHGHKDVDHIPFAYRGTDEAVRRCAAILDHVEQLCAREGRLCDAELIPCLRGLEGRQAVLAFDDGRLVRCLIGRRRFGSLVVHVAKQDETDHGEPLTFGSVRLVQVLGRQIDAGGNKVA
jgi:hypothetical protein